MIGGFDKLKQDVFRHIDLCWEGEDGPWVGDSPIERLLIAALQQAVQHGMFEYDKITIFGDYEQRKANPPIAWPSARATDCLRMWATPQYPIDRWRVDFLIEYDAWDRENDQPNIQKLAIEC